MNRIAKTPQTAASRRDFIKTSAAVAAASSLTPLTLSRVAYAQSSDTIRVGVVGCGGRGTGAAMDAIRGSEGVEITALGDLVQERLTRCREQLSEQGDAYQVTDDTCFVGFDAYKKVCALDNVDLVILATPPGFRPDHFLEAVKNGKHAFLEKPVAVDPVGVHKILEGYAIANDKQLGVVCGTQRRHQSEYLDMIDRIHNGEIGEIKHIGVYWNQGGLWKVDRTPQMSDMEWQCRNWLYFTWLSGDHIVEQHMHNIDVANWVMDALPTKCLGMGGRQSRTDPVYGHIFDHFAVEFEYPDGQRVLSMCRQAQGASNRVAEYVVGTKGFCDPGRWMRTEEGMIRAERGSSPYVMEHTNLVASIRAGNPLNEAKQCAEATLCAIAGRISAYSGRELQIEWVLNGGTKDLDLLPMPVDQMAFGPLPDLAVPIPGETRPDDTHWV